MEKKQNIIKATLEDVYPYLEKVEEIKEILFRFQGENVEELIRYLNLYIIRSGEPLKTDLKIFLQKLKQRTGFT